MNRNRKTGLVLVTWMTLALLLAACGAAGSAPLDTVGKAVGEGGGGPAPASSPGPADLSGSGSNSRPGGSNGNGNGAFKDDAKIVRTGTLSLQVQDLDATVSSARDQIRGFGGYVGASRQTNDGDRSVATITYRIPTDRWDDALSALRKLGKVLDEQTDAVEVTGQLIDLGARIDNLRASEKALQAIAARATKVSDVLEVQNRLSDVRGQIEQLEAQRVHLNDQASLGTLQVTYGLEVVAVVEASKGWNPGQEVDRASASLIGALQALTSAGIWFVIVWLPILVGLAIIAILATAVIRRLGILGRSQPAAPALPSDG
jgi:hypothetical protein